MTTNDKPVRFECRNFFSDGAWSIWYAYDNERDRDNHVKASQRLGYKVETRDLYDRPQPAAPQVPEGWVLVSREDAENLARFAFNHVGLGIRSYLRDAAKRVRKALATPPAPEQPKAECPCGEATCEEPWEPGCGLGRSEEHVRVAEQPKPAGDDFGLSLSPEQCAEWLDAKYRRHGEIEDKVCADTIRRLAAQPAQGEGEK